jgi:predicted kinase
VTLYLVTGPPASGKTTWVREQAKHGDITIDYDHIAAALTPAGGDPYDQPAHIKAVTKAARQAAIDAATAYANTTDVYLIHSMPSAKLLDHYKARGAQVVTIDPGEDVVIPRCKRERPWRMTQAAKQWYASSTEPERQDDDQPTINLGSLSESW